jgi:radical SAM superfamily enzyme YgiQ (UPF0313 family)
MAKIKLIGISEVKSPDGKIWKFPYAYPVIIKVLQQTGHEFSVVDTHLHKLEFCELLEYLQKCNEKIYGISAFSHNYIMVKQICMTIKEVKPDAVIIVGGLLSRNAETLLENTLTDIAATAADGENQLCEILDALDGRRPLHSVTGIYYKEGKRIIATPERTMQTNEDFNRQGRPAYEYFDKELTEMVENINSMKDVPVNAFPMLTMRGCPFRCTFCGHMYGHKFYKKNWKEYFDEVEFLQKRYGIQGIYSYDTNMFFNKRDVDEFCEEYEARCSDMKFLVELRPTFGDLEMFRKLKAHGVEGVLFGIESGSQKMLDNMKKHFDLYTMKRLFKDCMSAGLFMHGNLIFGTPGENEQTVKETSELMLYLEKLFYDNPVVSSDGKKIRSGYGRTFLIPAPCSELYDIAQKNGIIKDTHAYLMRLGSAENFKLLKGSKFKIALGESGGEVNMSDFKSLKAMKSYVNFIFEIVRFKRCFFSVELLKSELTNLSIFKYLFRMIKYYMAYLVSKY